MEEKYEYFWLDKRRLALGRAPALLHRVLREKAIKDHRLKAASSCCEFQCFGKNRSDLSEELKPCQFMEKSITVKSTGEGICSHDKIHNYDKEHIFPFCACNCLLERFYRT